MAYWEFDGYKFACDLVRTGVYRVKGRDLGRVEPNLSMKSPSHAEAMLILSVGTVCREDAP